MYALDHCHVAPCFQAWYLAQDCATHVSRIYTQVGHYSLLQRSYYYYSRAINTDLLLDKLRKSTRSLFKTNDPQRNPWLTNPPFPNTALPHIKRSGVLDTVELFINSSYSKAFFISLASYILKAHKKYCVDSAIV